MAQISVDTKFQLNISILFKVFTFLLSQILQGTFCNFVAMVTPQNVTTWNNLKNVSWTCIFKISKFQLHSLEPFQDGGRKTWGLKDKIGLKAMRKIKLRTVDLCYLNCVKHWLGLMGTPLYAGINLTGYHPPGHTRAFAPKCVPSPGAFALQKMPRARPIKDDVPGAGHLHQLAFKDENCWHSYLGLKIKLSECPIGPGKVLKTQNTISNCLFARSP